MNRRSWRGVGAVVLLCICSISVGVSGQSTLEFSVDPALAIPTGAFRDNVPENGIGATVSLATWIRDLPVMVGGELGFLVYGYENTQEPYNIATPDFTVRHSIWNNIMQAHVFVRWLTTHGNLRFFVEGLVGFKYFYTDSHIVNVGYAEGYPTPKSTNLSDHAFSYGIGAGLSLRIRKHREETEEEGKHRPERSGLILEGGMRYLAGSRADYLRKGSIQRIDGETTWDVLNSRTAVLVPYIGIRWEF
ncbi:hypothetical protein ACFL6T_01905 [Candidatus Zixiibacteriota bacterium]